MDGVVGLFFQCHYMITLLIHFHNGVGPFHYPAIYVSILTNSEDVVGAVGVVALRSGVLLEGAHLLILIIKVDKL